MHSLSPTLFHGNLSSRKIFFDKQWDVKLGDFTSSSALRRWSAAIIDTDDSEDSSVDNDTVIHLDMTVWSAPEVVDGRQYTERSDIYSFGILLAQLDTYECPSDLQPMMDDADVPLLVSNPRRHLQEGHVDGDAPSLVNLLMMQCRAFQPEDRPSASEALQRLLRIDEEIGNESSSSITSFY
jgi:serine/threonine protein kinase